MKRPWQIWTVYAAAVLFTAAAVGWLSLRALESDRAQAEARVQAEIEENVRLALWRLDSQMTAFVAQESARDYEAYQGVGTGANGQRTAFPLFATPPPDVLLNFQLTCTGKFQPPYQLESPQVPPEEFEALVVPNVISVEQLARRAERLRELAGVLDYESLVAQLPNPAQIIGASIVLANANTPAISPVVEQNAGAPGSQRATRGASEFQNRSQFLSQNNAITMRNSGQITAAAPAKDVAVLAPMRPLVIRDKLL